MATWKKVITTNDDANYKNESITLAQLDAGLDDESSYGAGKALKVNSLGNGLEFGTVTSTLSSLTNVTGFASASNGGAILIGQDSGQYAVKAVTGDVSVNKTGAITIGDDKVTYAKMQDTTTNNRVLGAGTAGTIAEVQVNTNMIEADAITNALIADDQIDSEHYVDGSIDTAHIANDAVDGTKLANNIDIAGTLDVTSTATFDSDVAILGKLTMTGDIDTVSVTDLDVADKTVTLASSSTAYSSQQNMLTATNNAGIRLQNQYSSGSVDTEADNMSASLTWDKDAGLSGWKAKHYTGTANAVPIALMDFKGDTGAPTGNSGGVGSFTFNTQDDELYVRIS